MNVMAFPENPFISPVQSLKYYLTRTGPLQHADATGIFLAYTKPHKSVVSQTLAWWIKQIMKDASIDISVSK